MTVDCGDRIAPLLKRMDGKTKGFVLYFEVEQPKDAPIKVTPVKGSPAGAITRYALDVLNVVKTCFELVKRGKALLYAPLKNLIGFRK